MFFVQCADAFLDLIPHIEQMEERDRYSEATNDFASHIGDKVLTVLRHPDNQSRLQSVLDPIVSHIIQRVFPYILLSAILFLILFMLTIGTFWIVVRSGGMLSVPVSATSVAKQIIEHS